MLNSRDIDGLRPDVAANCRIFIELCKQAGYPVLVTGTVRDDEYQRQCYKKGTGGKPPATFHSVKAGLAFDVCKNVKGQEYSDIAFFRGIAEVGKKMGFTWGGDWKRVDMPHFQWDERGKYSGANIIAGKHPPVMPLYKGETKVTKEEARKIVQEKAGLSDKTMEYLVEHYKWGDDLVIKLANAMK